MSDIFRQLMTQADAKGARSTILHPLQWTLAILLFGMFGIVCASGPTWLLIVLVIGCAATMAVMLWAYVSMAKSNPDTLRSETYSLSKMAMEKGLTGDNLSGLVKAFSESEPSKTKLIEAKGGDL